MKREMVFVTSIALFLLQGCDDPGFLMELYDNTGIKIKNDIDVNVNYDAEEVSSDTEEQIIDSDTGVVEDSESEVPDMEHWAGSWISMQSFLDDPSMVPAYEAVAAGSEGYTANGVKSFMEEMYYSEIIAVDFDNDTIAITTKSENNAAVYQFVEQIPITGYEGYYWDAFEAQDKDSAFYPYILLTNIHSHSEDGISHFHFRYGSEGFDSLVGASLSMWWPTMVSSDITAEAMAENEINTAESFSVYLNEMPPLQGWVGDWFSLAGFLDDPEMFSAYEAVANEAALLGKSYTPEEVQSVFVATYATDTDFSKVTVTKKEIVFYDTDGYFESTISYAYSGLEPMSEHDGYFWKSFEALDDTETYAYLIATDVHGDVDAGLSHWHMRYGGESIPAVMDFPDPTWYPTLFKEDAELENIVENFINHAATLAAKLP